MERTTRRKYSVDKPPKVSRVRKQVFSPPPEEPTGEAIQTEATLQQRAKRDNKRKERVPLGTMRQKGSIANRSPDKVYRWINDVPGRIEAAKLGGYEHVYEGEVGSVGDGNDLSQGTSVGTAVNRALSTANPDGSPMRRYLMQIDKDLYDSDQQAKVRDIQETEAALKRGQDIKGAPGVDGRYIPREGISIRHDRP